MNDVKSIQLLPGRERRLLQGHKWVFSNELAEPPAELEPGGWVAVHSIRGVGFGSGYFNPHSLIAVRLVCGPHEKPSREWFRELLQRAADRRENLFYAASPCARLVYGEADGLPGLIVDRYGEILVYQITTLGMSRLEDLLQGLLIELFQPRALVFRNDTPVRTLEGLPLGKGVAHGELPVPCWIEIDGLQFLIDPLHGQKTGFYLDQRDNRRALRRWARGRRVLDLFCYNGAWSLSAAAAGASEVVGVDQSREGLDQARESAARNGLDSCCRFEQEEAFAFLKSAKKGAFDLIVLDAFSSDAIPVHMLTREAVALYLRKTAPGGIVLLHISNRYLRLEPVVANIVADAGLGALIQDYDPSTEDSQTGASSSTWVAVARDPDDLESLELDDRWQYPAPDPAVGIWTDDYSNIFRTLRLR